MELRQAGAQKIFQVDTVEEIGVEELFRYIHERIDD
jgi:ethanolamine utilization protein EutP